MIRTKRVYDPAAPEDGQRILVDRLWPRGLSKAAARLDAWVRQAAPSDALRKWFGHDPAKWEEFRKRYRRELERHPETLAPIREASGQGAVTLLFAAHDPEHNNAVVLKEYLAATSGRRAPRKKGPPRRPGGRSGTPASRRAPAG